MLKSTTRIIIAASAALSYFTLVQADESFCGLETDIITVQPETTSYRIIPGEYKWVDGEQKGYSLEYRVEPAKYKTTDDVDVVGPASKKYVGNGRGEVRFIPSVTQKVTRKNLVQEAYPVAKFVANSFMDGRTRIQTKQPKFEAVKIPAQTRTISRGKTCEMTSSVQAEN